MSDLKNKVIGGFRVLREIQAGSGSQGTVYKAVCVDAKDGLVPVGTAVALKMMAVQDDSGAQWKRLQKRTAELVRMDHSNVVKYYGCFSEAALFSDVHVVVQEFLQGETLKERLSRCPLGLDVDEALRIADAALSALVYTSGCGIVHRDIKPGNIFLCEDGAVKFIDFEIARKSGGTVTSTAGNIRGSFDYMSPDFTNAEFYGDVRSDVFSMGVVFHEMLTGRTPYQRLRGDDKQANFAFLSRWAHPFENGGSPIRVSTRIRRLLAHADDVMARALAPRREDRYADFEAFRRGVREIRFRDLRNGPNVYRMLQFVGKGGFGEVFKARLQSTGQLVAVKHLLRASYSERFNREAKIMKKLRDSCFVQFVDFFMVDVGNSREAFLVMAYLDGMPGSSLRDVLKSDEVGRLPWRDVLKAFERYARGLQVLHGEGIFHRDIKPSNLYFPVGHPESAAIMDLGIARDVNGTATHGQVPGTLDYMPPEVMVSDSRGDGGMDVYALGLCLYEALTSQPAFPRLPTGSATYEAFFDRAKSRQKPAFDDADVVADKELLALLTDMTNPDPSRRICDAGIVGDRIRELLESRFPDTAGGPGFPFGFEGETVVADSSTMKTVPIQWDEEKKAALERERELLRSRRGGRRARTMRRIVKALSASCFVLALGAVGWFAWGKVRHLRAEGELNDVLNVYQTGLMEAGRQKEAAWRTRWAPNAPCWRRLGEAEYSAFVRRLEEEGEKHKVGMEERKMTEVRRQALDRIAACLAADGRLDEENYLKLREWTLPESLKGDAEVKRLLSAMGNGLVGIIGEKLSVQPVKTRRERLRKAKELLESPWTETILPEGERERLERQAVAASAWCVGVVSNCCDVDIRLDRQTIPAGGARVVVYEDGHPERRAVVRPGFLPVNLPADLDGRTYEVRAETFVARPIDVTFPAFGGDVKCVCRGREVSAGEVVPLWPGDYECSYVKGDDYEPQVVRFSVRADVRTEVPAPAAWTLSKPAVDRKKKREAELMALQDAVLNQCWDLMSNEPVEDRQDRLVRASQTLAKAVEKDHVLTEGDARIRKAEDEIRLRKRWIVGKIWNKCRRATLAVGGHLVAPGETKLFVFRGGLPEDWICRADGYEGKKMAGDFDGRTIVVGDDDLVAERRPQPDVATQPKEERKPSHKLGDRMALRLAKDGPLMRFVWCPPGSFLMGSPDDEKERESGEQQHRVTLTEGFWIGETEVTREQWKALMSNAGWTFSSLLGNDGLYPIDNVSWDDCQEFCRRFSKSANRLVRLPTEAEWEYACRAGTVTEFSFGRALNGSRACCRGATWPYVFGDERLASDARDHSGTARVGSILPGNPWGIYDMHGNVYEWCSDWYVKYDAASVTNPVGPKTGSARVIRGGCWNHAAKFCRSACRQRKLPHLGDDMTGFRVCLDGVDVGVHSILQTGGLQSQEKKDNENEHEENSDAGRRRLGAGNDRVRNDRQERRGRRMSQAGHR